MATIIFQRSGAVLGQDIDLFLVFESLPKAEAQLLFRLIEESGFFKIPAGDAMSNTRSQAKEFHYFISVEAGSTQHTLHTSESTMPASLRLLVDELTMLSSLGEIEPVK